jgi:4-hydroxy-tetrahydrodipicolinate reductase
MPSTDGTALAVPRIVVSGATGRLGRLVLDFARREGWVVQGVVLRAPTAERSPAWSELNLPGPPAPLVGPDGLVPLLQHADLYLGAVPGPAERDLLPVVAEQRVPAVVAGTGLGASDESWIEAVARQIPLVWEANYSPGIAWITRILWSAGRLPPGFEAGVVEAHHRAKSDRPSGTARVWEETLRGLSESNVRTSAGADPAPDVAILRLGQLPGTHAIWISGPGELIRIEHQALDRAVFARGMISAAEVLWRSRDRTPGRRRLSDLMLTGSRGDAR